MNNKVRCPPQEATFFISIKLYNKSYFEVGRKPRKRSLPSVNEHFEGKPDAKRALFDNFIPVLYSVKVIYQYAA